MPGAEVTPILRPRSVDSQVSGASSSEMLPQAELRRAITEENGVINADLYDIMASTFERPSQELYRPGLAAIQPATGLIVHYCTLAAGLSKIS